VATSRSARLHGLQWADAGVLRGAALLLVAVGVVWFNRRDINT
jgi:hypothetical protein